MGAPRKDPPLPIELPKPPDATRVCKCCGKRMVRRWTWSGDVRYWIWKCQCEHWESDFMACNPQSDDAQVATGGRIYGPAYK